MLGRLQNPYVVVILSKDAGVYETFWVCETLQTAFFRCFLLVLMPKRVYIQKQDNETLRLIQNEGLIILFLCIDPAGVCYIALLGEYWIWLVSFFT